MFQVACIRADDYKVMQSQIGYTESYEEHIALLTDGIPHNVRTMVEHIDGFLNTYPLFRDPVYVEYFKQLNENLQRDPETHKRRALQILIENNADKPEGPPPPPAQHPPLFEKTIQGQSFVLPTFCNPIMTSLYSILFTVFEKQQELIADE